MKCSRCQHDNHPGAKFCEKCAMPLERVCASCGTLVAHRHFGLGNLHAKTGRRKELREHLATATTLYRQLDMPLWLPQVETALGPSRGNSP
ncbi:MAG: zinc ribbon domain-containing protein [Burkholderiales bacterium]